MSVARFWVGASAVGASPDTGAVGGVTYDRYMKNTKTARIAQANTATMVVTGFCIPCMYCHLLGTRLKLHALPTGMDSNHRWLLNRK